MRNISINTINIITRVMRYLRYKIYTPLILLINILPFSSARQVWNSSIKSQKSSSKMSFLRIQLCENVSLSVFLLKNFNFGVKSLSITRYFLISIRSGLEFSKIPCSKHRHLSEEKLNQVQSWFSSKICFLLNRSCLQ